MNSKITSKWTTIKEMPYMLPVTDSDGAAAGGIILIQRRRAGGRIMERRIASNGPHSKVGQAYEIKEITHD